MPRSLLRTQASAGGECPHPAPFGYGLQNSSRGSSSSGWHQPRHLNPDDATPKICGPHLHRRAPAGIASSASDAPPWPPGHIGAPPTSLLGGTQASSSAGLSINRGIACCASVAEQVSPIERNGDGGASPGLTAREIMTAGRQGGSDTRHPSHLRDTFNGGFYVCQAGRSGSPPLGLEHSVAGLRRARLGDKDPRDLSAPRVSIPEPLFRQSRAFPLVAARRTNGRAVWLVL